MLSDAAFFTEHRDRIYRIREPDLQEFDPEFRALGPHDEKRRRIIVYRLPALMARAYGASFMPIPMLLFADESVEDTDTVLEPIFKGIMEDARKRGGDRLRPKVEEMKRQATIQELVDMGKLLE